MTICVMCYTAFKRYVASVKGRLVTSVCANAEFFFPPVWLKVNLRKYLGERNISL